jgi:exopolyphosphatase/guanosine-5'-triphosphate,3'-diphosphate pyrophosphatase
VVDSRQAVSVLDIGTSSVRILGVARADSASHGGLRSVLDRGILTRLGKDRRPDGGLDPDAVERTRRAVLELGELARSQGADVRAAVGTSALRDARGASSVHALLEEAAGCRVEIISGEREAELVVRGVKTSHGLDGPFALLDAGGGSTEIVQGRDGDVESLVSLDLGAGRLLQDAEERGLSSPDALLALAREKLLDAKERRGWTPGSYEAGIYGLGGTVTTLAALSLALRTFDPETIEGHVLHVDEIRRLALRLAGLDTDRRRTLQGMEPGREDLVVPGAAVVLAVASCLGGSSLVVTNHGIRWGLAAEILDAACF